MRTGSNPGATARSRSPSSRRRPRPSCSPIRAGSNSTAPVFVHSPVKGRVAAILVKEGQAVKRGDLLFKVKPDGDELKPLAKDGDRIVSIKAPCNGLVQGFRGPGPGDPVGKGTHVLTLGDDGVMRVHFDISEKHYLELVNGTGLGLDE